MQETAEASSVWNSHVARSHSYARHHGSASAANGNASAADAVNVEILPGLNKVFRKISFS